MHNQRGITVSAIGHTLVLAMLLIGMPNWLQSDPLDIPPAMVVDILPISDITNVRPNPPQAKQQEKTPPKPPEPKKEQKAEPTPKPPEKPKEVTPETPKKPEQKPKEEPKKPEKPAPPKETPKKDDKTKKSDDAFEDILKNLAKESADEKPKEGPKAKNTTYDASKPLSIGEIDYVRQQMKKCWRVEAGMRGAKDLVVTLRVHLREDGQVTNVTVQERMRYSSDSLFRVAAENAIRAVRLCAPYNRLPIEKYASWKVIDMEFDPREMLY